MTSQLSCGTNALSMSIVQTPVLFISSIFGWLNDPHWCKSQTGTGYSGTSDQAKIWHVLSTKRILSATIRVDARSGLRLSLGKQYMSERSIKKTVLVDLAGQFLFS